MAASRKLSTFRPRFEVRHVAGVYRVYDAKGRQIGDPQSNVEAARRARDELQRAADAVAKIGPRPCLRCQDVFMSEGIHNRLCPGCRSQADSLGDPQRPSIPRRSGMA